MNKETPEEAAVKYRDLKLPDDLYDGFIAGAKWMQDRMYSEEEVFELLYRFNKHTLILQELKFGNSFDVKDWFEKYKNK